MSIKVVIRWLAALGVLAAAYWVYVEPKPEPWVGLIGAGVVFLGTFLPSRKAEAGQDQTVTGGSVGVQAGRDASIGAIDQEKR